MHEDLMEQKFVGSAEFNLAEAVYARSHTKNHGWLKRKLENIKRRWGGSRSGCRMHFSFSRNTQIAHLGTIRFHDAD